MKLTWLCFLLILLTGCGQKSAEHITQSPTTLPLTTDSPHPLNTSASDPTSEVEQSQPADLTEEELVESFLQSLDEVPHDHSHTHDFDFTPQQAISFAIETYGTTNIDYVYDEQVIEYADGYGYYIGIKEGTTVIKTLFVTHLGEIYEEPFH